METFAQFLAEKEKMVKLYGLGPPPRMAKAVQPAKPYKPKYTGMNFSQIFPVAKDKLM